MSDKELLKEIERAEKRVTRLRRQLVRNRMRHPVAKDEQRIAIERLGGALKGKIKGDLVKWQRKIRAEWDR